MKIIYKVIPKTRYQIIEERLVQFGLEYRSQDTKEGKWYQDNTLGKAYMLNIKYIRRALTDNKTPLSTLNSIEDLKKYLHEN